VTEPEGLILPACAAGGCWGGGKKEKGAPHGKSSGRKVFRPEVGGKAANL